jgi:hypothetical protein
MPNGRFIVRHRVRRSLSERRRMSGCFENSLKLCEDGLSRAVRKATLQQQKPDGSGEAVSKLSIGRAFSPYACCCRIPGAAPQADIGRAFGALKSTFYNNLSAEGAISYQPGAQPQEKWV